MKTKFNNIYENYQHAVYGYFFYMTHDEQTAQDLSQETFLKIYLGLNKIKNDSNLKAWCMTIARNTFLSYARKKKPYLLGDEIIKENMAASGKSPEDVILQSEKQKEIHRLLLKLKECERTVIILRDYEGLSYEDIGGIMELTETVVKVRIYRARNKLRKLYEAVSENIKEIDA
ncbi:RNA polymerase sigma factor [Anaerovorax odorimutans]|uniref:RNA polymerase sigma factor n=1 Tax=Anaerovorax odorimutans TaxID=109327 RepID=UPI0004219AA8|nr:RNA polymerase sigma factor [Anaerovorax odorimutans]